MTTTDLSITAVPAPITLDLYKDIHKGIRAELFAVTGEAGRIDPSQGLARAALATHVSDVVHLLTGHADHEDAAIQPALEAHLPDLAERIEVDHLTLEARMDDLVEMASEAASRTAIDPGAKVHRIYLALASFTSDYLRHQDIEERVVMPALEAAVGFPEVLTIHQAILGNMPPEEMAKGLAVMMPAMNIDDRATLLGGMRAGAPAEVFQSVWSLVGSVLEVDDRRALAHRLDIAGARGG
ncbi:MAG: hemerythrin domain-containing protein [Acidimicrobiales bacterium]